MPDSYSIETYIEEVEYELKNIKDYITRSFDIDPFTIKEYQEELEKRMSYLNDSIDEFCRKEALKILAE